MRRPCCCSCLLFAVDSLTADDFFYEKILCVHRRERYPDANPTYSVRRETCPQNMANAFYTLFAVHRFFVVSPLFRCCLQIVYSGLNGYTNCSSDITIANRSSVAFKLHCVTELKTHFLTFARGRQKFFSSNVCILATRSVAIIDIHTEN